MKHFKLTLKTNTAKLPVGTNVEIISTSKPNQTQIADAIERKYGVIISKNNITTTNWI